VRQRNRGARLVNSTRVDYDAVLAALARPLDPAAVGAALLSAMANRYVAEHGFSALHEFTQSGATFLFDPRELSRSVA
jgi:hypothetical protein